MPVVSNFTGSDTKTKTGWLCYCSGQAGLFDRYTVEKQASESRRN